MSQQFALTPFRWYAWQMLPGYVEVPYFSPIFLQGITPRKTGKNILTLDFINALYAVGVQDFIMDFKVIRRAPQFLIANILDSEYKPTDRSVIISEMSYKWIESFTPSLMSFPRGREKPMIPDGDVQKHLSAYFTSNPFYHEEAKLKFERSQSQ